MRKRYSATVKKMRKMREIIISRVARYMPMLYSVTVRGDDRHLSRTGGDYEY